MQVPQLSVQIASRPAGSTPWVSPQIEFLEHFRVGQFVAQTGVYVVADLIQRAGGCGPFIDNRRHCKILAPARARMRPCNVTKIEVNKRSGSYVTTPEMLPCDPSEIHLLTDVPLFAFTGKIRDEVLRY